MEQINESNYENYYKNLIYDKIGYIMNAKFCLVAC